MLYNLIRKIGLAGVCISLWHCQNNTSTKNGRSAPPRQVEETNDANQTKNLEGKQNTTIQGNTNQDQPGSVIISQATNPIGNANAGTPINNTTNPSMNNASQIMAQQQITPMAQLNPNPPGLEKAPEGSGLSLTIENNQLVATLNDLQIPAGTATFQRQDSAPQSASYVGVDGLVKYASAGTPRISYDLMGNLLGILFEPQATNMIPSSNNFGNWQAAVNTTVNENVEASPDGNQSAMNLIMPQGGGTGLNSPTWNITQGSSFTFSFYAKANLYRELSVEIPGSGNFNLTLENNWQRYEFSGTAAQNTLEITFNNINEGLLDCFLWGVQLETGTKATSYIPTNGVPVTRGADIYTFSIPNFIKNEGTVEIEFRHTGGLVGGNLFSYLDNNAPLLFFGKTRNNLSGSLRINNSFLGGTEPWNEEEKQIAFSYGALETNIIDALGPNSAGGTNLGVAINPTLRLGGAGENAFFGYIKKFVYKPIGKTSAELTSKEDIPTVGQTN